MGIYVHSDTDAGGDASKDGKDDVGSNVLKQPAPVVTVAMAAVAVVTVRVVVAERTAALVRLEVPVLAAALLPVAAAAAAELLPELLDLLLDTEQRVVGLLLDALDDGVDAADDDVARGALDELDLDLGQAPVEDAADLEELEVDGDERQLLLGVADLGLDEEAVAERLLLARAVGLDLGRQVAVPGVRGGVQLEAVERQAGAALDEEVEADGGIRAALLVVGDVEMQVRGHQDGVSRVDGRREGADDVLIGLGDLGHDEEGGGRRREAELSVQHDSGCALRCIPDTAMLLCDG